MSEIQVGQINSTDGSTAITTGADGYVSFAKTQIGGRRNLIINGAMQVAQRGTSFTASGYTLDRWEYNPSGATSTITQEAFAAGTEVAGCKNFLKMSASAGNNNGGMIYKVEDVQSLQSGESFTLSFYAKGTNPTGGATRVRIRQYFGSGGSATVTVYDSTITLTSSWQRFTVTDTFDDLTGKTIGTGSYIDITIDQPDSDTGTSAWELNLTGVQLEVGTVATPFEHRSFGEELALCQRYYQKYGDASNFLTLFGYTDNTFSNIITTIFPVVMRASPTVSFTEGSNSNATLSAYSVRNSNMLWLLNRSGSGGQLGYWYGSFDAEL